MASENNGEGEEGAAPPGPPPLKRSLYTYVEIPDDPIEAMRELRGLQVYRVLTTRPKENVREPIWSDHFPAVVRTRLGNPDARRLRIVHEENAPPLAPPLGDFGPGENVVEDDPETTLDIRERIVNKTFRAKLGVGAVPLLEASNQTNETGVSLYYDDNCLTKKLPFNHRATSVAMAAGENIRIYGTAYLSRFRKFGSYNIKRLDFTLKDCSSGAVWIRKARELYDRRITEEQRHIPNDPGLKELFYSDRNRLPPNRCFDERDFAHSKDPEVLGGRNDRFWWSQSRSHASLFIPTDGGTSLREVDVNITVDTIRVAVGNRLILDGALHSPVYLDTALWCLEDNVNDAFVEAKVLKSHRKRIHINLDKTKQEKWPWLLKPSAAMAQAIILEDGQKKYEKSLEDRRNASAELAKEARQAPW